MAGAALAFFGKGCLLFCVAAKVYSWPICVCVCICGCVWYWAWATGAGVGALIWKGICCMAEYSGNCMANCWNCC